MEAKILKLFKKNPNSFLSGEQISAQLNITRSAVWKHIEKLRSLGYEFDAVPHLGYSLRITPDRLFGFEIESSIRSRVLGRAVAYFDTVDSTNTIAYELAKDGAREGTIVVAEFQKKGKGRLAREWVSPRYKGIYASIILRPDLTPFEAPKLTLITAVSVAQAIRAVTGVAASIKWPNDILVNNKKIAGILTEMEAEQDSVKFIILGIGVNVNTKKSDLPKGASSLLEESEAKIPRIELLKSILESIEVNYKAYKRDGFTNIKREWRDLSATLGKRVRASCMHRTIEGEAVDIDPDGALRIRLDTGFYEKVLAGDILLLR